MASLVSFINQLQGLADQLPKLSPPEKNEAVQLLCKFTETVAARYRLTDVIEKNSEADEENLQLRTDQEAVDENSEIMTVFSDKATENIFMNDGDAVLENAANKDELNAAVAFLEGSKTSNVTCHVENLGQDFSDGAAGYSREWDIGNSSMVPESPTDIASESLLTQPEMASDNADASGDTKTDTLVDILKTTLNQSLADPANPNLITVVDEHGAVLQIVSGTDDPLTTIEDTSSCHPSTPTETGQVKNPSEHPELELSVPAKEQGDPESTKRDRPLSGCLKQPSLYPEPKVPVRLKTVSFASSTTTRSSSKPPAKLTLLTIPSNISRKDPEKRNGQQNANSLENSCTCPVCGKTLNNPSNLKVHMRTHSGARPYPCSHCRQAFTTQANLLRHEATHTGQRQHECATCLRAFTDKKSLTIHQRIHTGEKPYKCPVCSKMFRHSSSFRAHSLIHAGAKKHVCDKCGKGYIMKGSLLAHMRSKHSTEQRYQCDLCDKIFLSKDQVQKHRVVHFGKKFTCDYCSAQFFYSQSYISHLEVHKLDSRFIGARPTKTTAKTQIEQCESQRELQAFTEQAQTRVVEPRALAEKRKLKLADLGEDFTSPPKKLCGLKVGKASHRAESTVPVMLRSGNFVLVDKNSATRSSARYER